MNSSLLGLVNNYDNPSPPKCSKKDETSSRARKPQSKIFSVDQDLKQFQEIHEAVQCSEVAINADTPLCIIQIIAEYGTGMVYDCAVTKCNNKVVSLYADHDKHPSYRCCQSTNHDYIFFIVHTNTAFRFPTVKRAVRAAGRCSTAVIIMDLIRRDAISVIIKCAASASIMK